MKVIGSIVASVVGIFSILTGIQGSQVISQAKSQGLPTTVGSMGIDASIIVSLVTVVGILTFIGAIGGIMKKSWSKKVVISAIGTLVLLQIIQGNMPMAIIVLVLGLIAVFV